MTPVRPLLLLGAALLVAAPASGAPTIHLLHDVPDDGYTYVGNPVRFGYVLLDDGATQVHKNGMVRVVQNNLTLYETSVEAGHDYDALNTFVVAFPMPGPYQVHAEIPGEGSVVYATTFEGVVAPARDDVQATLVVDRSGVGRSSIFNVHLEDANGTLLPHTDFDVEVRRSLDNWLVFRTHVHVHDTPTSFTYTFPLPGDYLVRVVGYTAFPEPDVPHFAPVHTTFPVSVPPAAPMGDLDPDPLPAAKGSAPFVVLPTVDPYAANAPTSRFVLSALVHDPTTNTFVPHVDFSADIRNADTGELIFRSVDGLHEYDGNFDVVLHWPQPGRYVFRVAAERGDWVGTAELPFTVAEVSPTDLFPTSAGAAIITATGLGDLKSGVTTPVTFSARTLLGTPAMHSEIDFQITRHPWGPPLLQNKIHTHGSGDFEVQLLFPEPGGYILAVDPVAIHGEPTGLFYGQDVTGPLLFPLTVAPGVALPIPPIDEEPAGPVEPAQVLPGLPAAALLGLALLLGAALRRRR